MNLTRRHPRTVSALLALCVLGLGSTPALAQFPLFSLFDNDPVGLPPSTGGWHQPGDLTVPSGGSITVAPFAGGLSPNPVVLSDDDGDYTSVNWYLIQIVGMVRVEADVTIATPFYGNILQTASPSGAVMGRFELLPNGTIRDAASGTPIGTYQAGGKFRLRMDVDPASATWAATIDTEMDGFADDTRVSGLQFMNTGVTQVGRVLASLNVYGPLPATAVYDNVYIGRACLGQSVCTPVANSTGLRGRLCAIGPQHLSQDYLRLEALNLPAGEFGYFLASRNLGGFVPPGSVGILCLSGDIGRFNHPSQVFQAPHASLEVDLSSIPVNPAVPVMPGEFWNFQCWYRDGTTSNFTDAVRIQFL